MSTFLSLVYFHQIHLNNFKIPILMEKATYFILPELLHIHLKPEGDEMNSTQYNRAYPQTAKNSREYGKHRKVHLSNKQHFPADNTQ